MFLLNQLHDLSDDQVVERWVDKHYWQFLSGEHELQWSAPVASSDLTHFRKRIGKKGAESILRLSVDLFHPKIKQEEVVVDTTVQEKSITYPTTQNWPRRS
ncbi:MAG: transposase [Gammaproteobacteria bacterium]|nr:transposase [Gammaproteobacteria bacterium]